MNERLVTQHTAKRVRQLRLAKEWSQENLALTADLSVAYVGQIERGEKVPSIETIGKICAALEVSLPYFFTFDETWDIDGRVLVATDSVVSSMKAMPAGLASRVALLVEEIKNLTAKS